MQIAVLHPLIMWGVKISLFLHHINPVGNPSHPAGPCNPHPRCNGGTEDEIDDCCEHYGPYCEGQGDCNDDNECGPGLICGDSNCGQGFYYGADCCASA